MSFQKFSSGPYFPLAGRIVGGVFFLLGLAAIFDRNPAGLIVGPFMLIGATLLLFSYKGVLIDYSGARFRPYVSVLGLMFGKWHHLSHYPYITTLEMYMKHETGTKVQYINIDSSYHDYEYRVCFLSADHRQKKPVYVSQNKNEALKTADLISEKTGLKQVVYNPVSVSRQNRRRKK
jgi:hypothetical protein